MAEQLQQSSCRTQPRGSKMDRQKQAMQKPGGNGGGTDQHAGISREQRPEECRTENEDAGGDAQ